MRAVASDLHWWTSGFFRTGGALATLSCLANRRRRDTRFMLYFDFVQRALKRERYLQLRLPRALPTIPLRNTIGSLSTAPMFRTRQFAAISLSTSSNVHYWYVREGCKWSPRLVTGCLMHFRCNLTFGLASNTFNREPFLEKIGNAITMYRVSRLSFRTVYPTQDLTWNIFILPKNAGCL